MPRCPGQDQRFWKPDDIFEIECSQCGSSVEFWKDEPQVKCPNCKSMLVNPKLDLGCATWCQYAEECLEQISGQEGQSLSNKLIEYLRKNAGSNQKTIRLSLEILSYAEKIQREEGGNPLVVKASAILSQIYKSPAQAEPHKDSGGAIATEALPVREILARYGIQYELIDSICRILSAYHCDSSIDSLEFKIVSDACRLAQLKQRHKAGDSTATEVAWKTQTARRLAVEM